MVPTIPARSTFHPRSSARPSTCAGEHGWLAWTLASAGVGIGRRTPAGAIEEWPADSDLTTYQSMHVAADGLYWIERGPENALSTWYWGEGEPTRLAVTTDELFHLTDVDEAHLYGGVGQSIVRIPKTGGDLEVLVEREEDQPVGPFALSRNRLIYTRGLTGAGVFEMDTSTVEERAVGELPESYPVGPITVGEPEVYVGRDRFADGERRTLLPEDEHDATFETPGAMIIRSVFLRGGALYWLASVGTEPEMGVPGPKTWSLYSTPK